MSKSDLRSVSQPGPGLAVLCPSSSLGFPRSIATPCVRCRLAVPLPPSPPPLSGSQKICVFRRAGPSPNQTHTFFYHSDSQSQQEGEMSQKGTSVSAICLELKVVGSRPLGEACCFHVSRGAGSQAATVLFPLSLSVTGGLSATLTGLDHHVRELFHLGGPPDIVQDGQGLQVLGHTARRGRGFRVQGVVQSQHLRRTHH